MRRGLLTLSKLVMGVAALATSALSCGREVTGPPGGARMSAPLSFAPQFPAGLRAPDGGLRHVVAFERVRVVFRRSDGGVSLDQTIDFPSDADSVAVRLIVPVSAGAPESGELLALSLYYVDASNDTVFTGGPVPVIVRGARPGEPPAEPVPVTLTYTGPGREAVRVALAPTAVALTAGQTQAFTPQAFDALDNPLQAPVLFESTDTSVVTVTEAGLATARSRRGSAFVIARLYGGAADTSSVSVALPAATIAPTSGSGQTGPAGTVLGQNVIVLVTAADAVPVAGVPVTFAATAGGLPGQTVVNTDAAGFASTTWTLGGVVGAQTMTATVAGLAGSPVTFTATATPAIPTSLAFTALPAAVVAGQAIAPAVVVEARTSGGALAVGYADGVTIALASNPGGATLAGTRTVAAVNGIATFADLSLDRAASGYTFTATSGALTPAASGALAVTAAAATSLAFDVQPGGGTPGVGMLPAPVVRAFDPFGNAAGFTGAVTVAIGANPGGATLGGTTTVSAVAGAATFAGLTISTSGIGYTLVATSPGLAGATSDPFTIGAATIAWANPSGGNWSVASNWNLNRVPDPTDVVQIALGGTYAVTLDVSPTVAGLEIGTGASGTQTLQATSRTLTVAGDVVTGPNGAVLLTGASIVGSGTFNNDGLLTLSNGTLGLALDNRATTVASGTSALTGGVSNVPGATLRVAQVDGCCSTATLTVATGFTNEGLIELSNQITIAYGAQLNVVGTLVNAVGATIASVGGQTPGGGRGLAADLDNRGTLTVAVPLTLSGAGASHENSGTIDVSADLTIQQSGASPSFTNTGTLSVAAGRTLAVAGGALALVSPIDGAGNVNLTGVTATLTSAFSNATAQVTFSNSIVNGTGTFTNAAGRTLVLYSTTIGAPFVNAGLAIANGNSTIAGAFSNTAGATLRVAQVDGCCSTATLTVTNGFTNDGLIELSNQITIAYGAQLNVVGTLVNAPGATIASIGGQTPGGARGLAADLDNRGTLTVAVPLTLGGAGATHESSGTIDVSADLTIQQSGASPSFTNTGVITLAPGRTLATAGGAFTQSGTVGGAGTLAFASVTVALDTPLSNTVTALSLTNTVMNGPATLTNASGRTLLLSSGAINAPLVNEGVLVTSGNATIGGAFANAASGTLRVAQVDGCCSTATLTVANGFTNEGLIELSNQITIAYGAQLNVVGTLVNAVGGTIASIGGQTPGGGRGLAADLDNRGTLTVAVPLILGGAGATHENSGTIDVSADLTIQQSGASPSFTNTGTVLVGAGRTLLLQGGVFVQSAGTLDGTGALSVLNATLTLGTPLSNATMQVNVAGSTVNGTSPFTNVAARTLALYASTIAAPFVNQGLAIASGTSAFTGAFTNQAGATLRVAQLDGCCSTATLTVANGFTNEGLIEISNQITIAYGAQLNVGGTLVNAVGATIASIGGQTPGGARGLAADLDNRGTLTVAVPLTLSGAGASHENSGTIDVSADLQIQQSGASPSLTNSGALTIATGRTLTVQGGTFTQASGTLGGAGTLVLQGLTAGFATDFSNATTGLTLVGTTVNGPATLTNAATRTLVLNGSTVNAPFVNGGITVATGTSVIGGAFANQAGATLRVAQVDGCCSTATLTVANGFTNEGLIELSNQFTVAYGAQLNVGGTLVNAAGATIASLGGQTPGGGRALAADLDNRGTLTVAVPLTLSGAGATHENSGTIDVSADLLIQQSGTSPSFTNSGAVTIGAGRALQVTGGSFTSGSAASLSGGAFAATSATVSFQGATPAVATMALVGGTTTFAQPVSTATTAFALSGGVQLNGTGPFANAAGQTLTLNAVTINMPVDNQGTLVSSGASSIASLTMAAGSVLRVGQIDGATSLANLTVANGFANNGTIEITNAFPVAYSSRLTISSGELLNTASGTILSSAGTLGGGTREISVPGAFINQGTLSVHPGAAGRLAISTVAGFQSSGTVNLELGGLVATTGYDLLAITGPASLGGTLNVGLVNAFTPASGNSFIPITSSGALTGTFATIVPPGGVTLNPTYGAGSLTLTVP